jgi:hypothetical protein
MGSGRPSNPMHYSNKRYTVETTKITSLQFILDLNCSLRCFKNLVLKYNEIVTLSIFLNFSSLILGFQHLNLSRFFPKNLPLFWIGQNLLFFLIACLIAFSSYHITMETLFYSIRNTINKSIKTYHSNPTIQRNPRHFHCYDLVMVKMIIKSQKQIIFDRIFTMAYVVR